MCQHAFNTRAPPGITIPRALTECGEDPEKAERSWDPPWTGREEKDEKR